MNHFATKTYKTHIHISCNQAIVNIDPLTSKSTFLEWQKYAYLKKKQICWKTFSLYNMFWFINLPNKYQFRNKQMNTIFKNHKLHFIIHQNFIVLETHMLIASAYKLPFLQPQALARGSSHNLRPFFEMLNDCTWANCNYFPL